MGRKRTTGCVSRHLPGEQCGVCAAERMCRARKRAARARAAALAAVGEEPPKRGGRRKKRDGSEHPTPDQLAAEHRRTAALARAFVHDALKHGRIVPPSACERCGVAGAVSIGRRSPVGLRARSLHAWHPDPLELRDVAWLCFYCRRYLRATREPIVLRWTWPGVPAAPARPIAVAPEQCAALAADEPTAELRRRLPGLADELFFTRFRKALGDQLDPLYAQGARAAARGKRWQPTGDSEFDALLQRWIEHERDEREAEASKLAGRVVVPRPAWERRRREQRPAALPKPARAPRPPFDEAAHTKRITATLTKLEEADALAEATNARITAVLAQLRAKRG